MKNLKFILFAFFFSGQVLAAELIDKTIAIVNNEVIVESDLKGFSNKIGQNGMVDEMLLFGVSLENLKKNRDSQLQYLINEKVLESEIKRLNLNVTIERVEQEIREVAKRNNVGRNELVTALKAQGVELSDYQDFIKKRIERQSLIEQEISSRIRISDDDVLALYVKQRPSGQTQTFEFSISHIFFNPQKGGLDAANDRALGVLKKLNSKQSFENLAEQYSEDKNFNSGGLLGVFKTGELSEEFLNALQNIEINQHTDVVKSKSGLHILKLNTKKAISDPQFEKEKEKLRAQIFEVAFQKNFKNWLESKKEDSFVKINK